MSRHLFPLIALIGILAGCASSATPAPTASPSSPTSIPAADLPWWNDRVFYEIFVRSFYDSDGDGIGDLQGVAQKLDYLNDGDPDATTDLGITGIWLMPVVEAASYHGYDATDYYTVEEDYGTNADFRQLIEAAHARDIAVIVDLALNHTPVEHPWFVASSQRDPEYADWYLWADEPLFDGPGGRTVWHRSGDLFYYGLFWEGMPDLNLANPDVTAQMQDVTRFWLEDMGADGLRMDAAKHLLEDGPIVENAPATLDWLAGYDDFIDTLDPQALTVGEVWSASDDIARYVNGDAVDIAFEFNLADALIDSVQTRRAAPFVSRLNDALSRYPAGQYATFISNHDQNRAMSQFLGDIASAKVAATLLLTGPGVPFVYYGEEIGMVGQKPDERIRTPMQWTADPLAGGFTSGTPWEALSEGVDVSNVADQMGDPDSLWIHYHDLIGLRNTHQALRRGTAYVVESSHPAVFALLRAFEGEAVLVVANLSGDPVSEYGLTLASGPLAEVGPVEVLMGGGEAAPPEITAAGGFADYVPAATLEGRGTVIVLLRP